ncbi:MAG: Gldg family protein [Eubacteriales bacterium]|nr:Gldg family protein [Eubacteriales bacterium]
MKLFNSKNKKTLKTLTQVFILIVLFALLTTTSQQIEAKYALKKDLSFNNITSYSSVTEEVLKSLEKPVKVYALFTPGEEDYNLITLLERYAAKSPYFSFSIENLAENPALIHSVSDSLYDGAVTSDCLIVHSESNNRTRIIDAKDYVSQSFDPATGSFVVDGATYESSLTQAIAYVSGDELPTIYMLKGHGEIGSDASLTLIDFLKRNNYAVKELDLLKNTVIPEDGLLMILSPLKDLSNAELTSIKNYAEKGGSLFITTDYNNPHNMKNFNALLRYYGVEILPGIVSANIDDRASYYENPLYLMPYMQESEITSTLISLAQDRLIFAGARAFITQDSSGSLQISPLLVSGKAHISNINDDGTLDLDNYQDKDAKSYTLAVLSNRASETGMRSKAFISGNSSAFIDEWLYANSYSSEFLLSTIQSIYRETPSKIQIKPKTAFRKPMEFNSTALPTIIIALPPVIIASVGFVILIKRRNL